MSPFPFLCFNFNQKVEQISIVTKGKVFRFDPDEFHLQTAPNGYPNPTRYPVFFRCPTIPDPILKNPTRWALPTKAKNDIIATHKSKKAMEVAPSYKVFAMFILFKLLYTA